MRAFHIEKRSKASRARLGELLLPHGKVRTPAFLPVGTYGVVKGLPAHQIEKLQPSMILANALHLWCYPGRDVLLSHGGIHTFLGWSLPILTDSGGYQLYSLKNHRKMDEEGVAFRHPRDGRHLFLTPEEITRFQQEIGVDIAMVLDVCPPVKAEEEVVHAVELTTKWARRCKAVWNSSSQLLFGIVQGGKNLALREKSAKEIQAIGFDGYAIGGLGIGETVEERVNIVHHMDQFLPEDFPRYLMGVGYPEDIENAVKNGVDLFDCVLPTRNARNGQLFTSQGVLVLKKASLACVDPPDPHCSCLTCQHYSLGYLAYLYRIRDMGAAILATIHNLSFYLDFMEKIRHAIASDKF